MREKEINIRIQKDKGIKKIVKGVLTFLVVTGILSAAAYRLCDGYMDGIKSVLPNVAYMNTVVIGDTKVPYFVSFVPVEKLRIYDAPNLNMIIAPFGIEEIEYKQSDDLKAVKIPENTISVELNCVNLKDFELPDGVIELTLHNVSDELLSKLELPDSLKKLSLAGNGAVIDSFTDKGIRELDDEDSIEYLKIENSYVIEDLTIDFELKGLSILESQNLKSVVLNDDVEAFRCRGNLENLIINGKIGIVDIGAVDNLSGMGKIEEYYGGELKQIALDNVPRVFGFDYAGADNLVISDGVEVLNVLIDDPDRVTLPENIRAAKIWHYDGQEGVGDANLYGAYFNFLSGHNYDMEEMTWPSLEEVVKYYTEPTRGSF